MTTLETEHIGLMLLFEKTLKKLDFVLVGLHHNKFNTGNWLAELINPGCLFVCCHTWCKLESQRAFFDKQIKNKQGLVC